MLIVLIGTLKFPSHVLEALSRLVAEVWLSLTPEGRCIFLKKNLLEQSVLVKERKSLCMLSCTPQNQDIMTRSTFTLTLTCSPLAHRENQKLTLRFQHHSK